MTGTEPLAQRYRLGRLLGQGGMGAVHEARDLRLERDVAVKLLDVGTAPAAAVQRFRREAQYLAGLTHPNVVTVFDFGTDDEHAWLVMELLPGPTLQQLLDAHGPLPVADVRRYARQAASALAAAHAAGITHRDVKPANLMLAGDGSCTLLDLGIARLNGAVTTQPALTQAGTILGTVPYLAPEVITGGAPEPPADLYALGGTLFALLTGRPPFPGEDLAAAMAQHVHAPPPRPSEQRADIPRELDDLVHALLAKDPAQRPTAADVAGVLDGTLPTTAIASPAGAPTVALGAAGPAAGGTQLLSRPAGRSRRPWLIGAAALLALLVVLGIVLANSGGDTSGQRALTGSTAASSSGTGSTRSSSTPAPRRSSSHTSSRPTTRPASRSAPAPATLAAALARLQQAVTDAVASGALSGGDAADLLKRIGDMTAAAGAPKPHGPGPGPAHGGKHGGDHGGATSDLSKQVSDFADHVDKLHNDDALSPAGYASIESALAAVQKFAGSSGSSGPGSFGDGNGDGGG